MGKMRKKRIPIIVCVFCIVLIGIVITVACFGDKGKKTANQENNNHEGNIQNNTIITECAYSKKNPLIIEIDPGHGGEDSGAIVKRKDKWINEKDVNYRIAKSIKNELRVYKNVRVFMTRKKDDNPSIEERVKKAVNDKAHILLSVHNNAYGDGFRYKDGAMVLAQTGNINKKLAKNNQKLAAYILRNLANLGIADRGLLLRTAEDGKTYSNGKLCDYYGIIRLSAVNGISGLIIEHAYIDDEHDYESYLSSEKKLNQLAAADAEAIAEYYHLRPVLKKTEKYLTQTIIMVDEDENHTKYIKKEYVLQKKKD